MQLIPRLFALAILVLFLFVEFCVGDINRLEAE